MTTISVRMAGETVAVEATEVPFTRGVFATHEAVGTHTGRSLFWTATHVPSGRCIELARECLTQQHAEFMAQLLYLLLIEAGIDPRRVDLRSELERHGDAFVEQIRQRLSDLSDALNLDDDEDYDAEFDPDTVDDPDEVSRG